MRNGTLATATCASSHPGLTRALSGCGEAHTIRKNTNDSCNGVWVHDQAREHGLEGTASTELTAVVSVVLAVTMWLLRSRRGRRART